MAWREPDPFKVVRNTRTLEAYRARKTAAFRASMPFLILPLSCNLAVLAPVLNVRWPHMPPWIVLTGVILYFVAALASLGFGVYRRRTYLRDHPFVEQ